MGGGPLLSATVRGIPDGGLAPPAANGPIGETLVLLAASRIQKSWQDGNSIVRDGKLRPWNSDKHDAILGGNITSPVQLVIFQIIQQNLPDGCLPLASFRVTGWRLAA